MGWDGMGLRVVLGDLWSENYRGIVRGGRVMEMRHLVMDEQYIHLGRHCKLTG